ncbi:hypothetical protein ACF3NW_03455 [Eikenella halliae]|uniref:hypothetical protein n=1 Tax=Eikenella halliae TaxID=1795832 RepID=UPI0028D0BF07|nr:hypothetical protein [Eikenella halliae]
MNVHSGSYALSAGAAERSAVFREIRACMFEAAQPQVAANPVSLCARKIEWSEGSLAKPNLCPQSPFFCFLFFGEAKKTRSPKEDEFLRSKNEAFVRRIRFNKVKIRPLAEGLFLRG